MANLLRTSQRASGRDDPGDDLNTTWDRGINISDYLGDLGHHGGCDAGRHVPLVFARANDSRLYGASGMGYDDDASCMGGLSEHSNEQL